LKDLKCCATEKEEDQLG